jgi:hypothetical protein
MRNSILHVEDDIARVVPMYCSGSSCAQNLPLAEAKEFVQHFLHFRESQILFGGLRKLPETAYAHRYLK